MYLSKTVFDGTSINPRTKFLPSDIGKYFDNKTTRGPSILTPRDPRYKGNAAPLYDSVQHHFHPLAPLDPNLVRRAINDYERCLNARMRPMRLNKEMLSFEESLFGIPGLPGYTSVYLETSAGWPWKIASTKGKKGLLDLDFPNRKIKYISPILRDALLVEQKKRSKGEAVFSIFQDCLKDELLPLEKIEKIGKTRIFSMVGLPTLLRSRMLFLDFSAAYMHNRMACEHMIGCNPESTEWAELYDILNVFGGRHIVLGDYSKFGDRLPCELVQGAYQIMINWMKKYYPDYPEIEAWCLCIENMHCTHLAGNTLYRVACGQPSGNPLTVIVNSMVNSMLMRMAWYSLNEKVGNSNMSFYTNTRLFTYGDDVICAVSPAYVETFNTVTLQNYFASFGLAFTDIDKDGIVRPYVQIKDAVFLKRGFLFQEYAASKGLILANLDRKVIEDMINWRTNKVQQTLAELQHSEAAIRMAASWGPAYYTPFARKICDYWSEQKKINLPFTPWKEMLMSLYLDDSANRCEPLTDYCSEVIGLLM